MREIRNTCMRHGRSNHSPPTCESMSNFHEQQECQRVWWLHREQASRKCCLAPTGASSQTMMTMTISLTWPCRPRLFPCPCPDLGLEDHDVVKDLQKTHHPCRCNCFRTDRPALLRTPRRNVVGILAIMHLRGTFLPVCYAFGLMFVCVGSVYIS